MRQLSTYEPQQSEDAIIDSTSVEASSVENLDIATSSDLESQDSETEHEADLSFINSQTLTQRMPKETALKLSMYQESL